MTKTDAIPSQFDAQFIDWFRERMEAYWAALPLQTAEETLAQYVKAGAGGSTWQQGTRWLQGLREDEIGEIERKWDLRFPPDYHLFLRHLHSVDKPMLRSGYRTKEELTVPDAEKYLATAFVHDWEYMVLSEGPSFYNWQTDTDAINGRFTRLWEGLQFDVEHDNLWLDSWGDRPASLGEQKQRVRELVLASPKLIPIYAHRYLLAEPCVPDNPVLSVHQSDIIVYGANLRDYLIAEFGKELALDEEEYRDAQKAIQEHINATYQTAADIPFWGEILTM